MIFKENNNSFYTFYNGDFDFCVRAINEDGEIWFPVKDILAALKCSKKVSYEQIEELIPEMWLDDKDFGRKEMFSMTEQGLCFLLNQWTNKMNVSVLRCWIDNSVVPSILENNLAQDENAEIRRRDEELSFKKAELLKRVLDIQSYAMNDEAKLAFIHEIYRLVTGKELPSNVNTLPKTPEVKEVKYYTAEELGKMFGVSAEKINSVAQENGLISEYGTSNEYGKWCHKKEINND